MEKTFIGEELYSAITLNSVKLPYKAGSKLEGQYYYTGRWGSRGFTCSEQFYKDFTTGQISQLTLAETSYEATDASGQKVTRDSATIMGYINFERQIRINNNMTDLEVSKAKREITVKHAQKVAVAELGLSKADMELLKEFA